MTNRHRPTIDNKMPRIHIASDLHAELSGAWRSLRHQLSPTEDLVLAGDVGGIEDGSWAEVLQTLAPLVRHVYVVLGNHDVWSKRRTPVDSLVHTARTIVAGLPNATLLHRDVAVTPEGLRLLGCPMWSNPLRRPDPDYDALTGIADRYSIYVGDHKNVRAISFADMQVWHKADAAWLTEALGASCPAGPAGTLVVTHFAPLEACNPPRYTGSPLLAYFCNEAPLLVGAADAWVYGHVHGGAGHTLVGRTRVVRHCVGYTREVDRMDTIGVLELG